VSPFQRILPKNNLLAAICQFGHLQGLATSKYIDTARRVRLQIGDTHVHRLHERKNTNPSIGAGVLNERLQRTLGLDGTYLPPQVRTTERGSPLYQIGVKVFAVSSCHFPCVVRVQVGTG